ncbi:MAG TPA: sigma-54 factor interaction domain-containing protein, partial [Polyangiaceae bacterium]|nr:sigma-54 factor interaction domain-containing protein [Polyangiaceae bacterium]
MRRDHELLTPSERHFAETLSELSATNPFLERRIRLEREALGEEFSEPSNYWVPDAGAAELTESRLGRPNLDALGRRAERVVAAARQRFARLRGTPSARDLQTYHDACLYVLLYRYDAKLFRLSRDPAARPKPLGWYPEFVSDYEALLHVDGVHWPVEIGPDTALALLFQLRRAFHYIFRYILGSSPVSAHLRAETWTSIFTHDLRRYQTSLFRRMHDIVTLVTGPTGSGKELVAQALGLSRYVPFDAKRKAFADAFAEQYHALHLAALPVALLESELFGHRRGAFTGAVEDRIGWLEACGPSGTIFLDEVGELPAEVQVKLLRAIHARTFNRLGESTPRAFLGKLVAATHRDLAHEVAAGRFRADLYYRLSADQIRTPALQERLASDPDELANLVRLISRRVAGEDSGEVVAEET